MIKFKRLIKFAAVATLLIAPAVVLSGCGKRSTINKNNIKVGVVGSQTNKIWQPAQRSLKKKGIHLKVVDFSDYNQPNQALKNHDIQINAFQTYQFLNNWNRKNHAKLTPIGKTTIGPLGLYSYKIHKLSQLKHGDTVALSNDSSNEARGLNLLKSAGLIKLKKSALPSKADVYDNKKDLKLKPVAAAETPRTLKDVSAAVINDDFASDAKLSKNDLVYNEKLNKKIVPYINIIVSNHKNHKNRYLKTITKAFQTKATARAIKKEFHGNVKPGWNLNFE